MSFIEPRRALLSGSVLKPTWSWDFARTQAIPPGSTFARASSASYFDGAGVLRTANSNVPRFDHDPATGAPLGYLVELQSTNSIRNNTMVGAAAGTPGTPPANWGIGGFGTGISSSVIGTGTVNGINYIDIRVFGTAVGASGGYVAVMETSSGIAASVGQVWTTSAYLALVGGSFTNVTNLSFDNVEYPGGHDNGSTNLQASITSSLKRFSTAITIANSGTTNVQPRVTFGSPSNTAIDFTLRIGLPQIELQSGATSPILTSGSAVTRAQDSALLPLASMPRWNASAGGVLVAAYRVNALLNSGMYFVSLDNNTFQNIITFKATQGSGTTQAQMVAANATQFTISGGGSPTAGTREKVAIGWSVSRGQYARNGGTPAVATGAFTIPPLLTQMEFGTVGGGPIGTIESVAYYVGARSDTFVQQVSR